MTLSALGAIKVHVDIGIMAIRRRWLADRNIDTIGLAAIDQAMAIAVIFRKCGTIPSLHACFARVVDQHRFACQHHDKFVFPFVPVPLRRPCSRLERHMADTKIFKP